MTYGSNLEGSNSLLSEETGLMKLLSDGRQSLALFQHHDGVTGTARDPVVVDYGQKYFF